MEASVAFLVDTYLVCLHYVPTARILHNVRSDLGEQFLTSRRPRKMKGKMKNQRKNQRKKGRRWNAQDSFRICAFLRKHFKKGMGEEEKGYVRSKRDRDEKERKWKQDQDVCLLESPFMVLDSPSVSFAFRFFAHLVPSSPGVFAYHVELLCELGAQPRVSLQPL